jgi:TPR repeat protein
MGNLSSDMKEWDYALRWYGQSLASWRKFQIKEFGNKSGEALALNSIGTVFRHQRRWNDAIAAHERALKIFQLLGMREGEARALANIASVHAEQGRKSDAAARCEQAVAILRELRSMDETLWRQAAEAGSTAAAFRLGLLLADQDPDEAERWYRQAAQAGDLGAAVNLGVLIRDRDPADAERWYRIAANGGDRDGQYNLALLLERDGQIDEAETWFRKAAGAGNQHAQQQLASMLARQGKLEEARTWWAKAEKGLRKAANAGDRYAVSSLAELLYRQERLQEAEPWFRKLADTGSHQAETNLALLLWQQGKHDQAETWLRKAAAAGHAPAISNLGELLEERRIEQYISVLREWFSQAPNWAASATYLAKHARILLRPLAVELLSAECSRWGDNGSLWEHLGLLLLGDQVAEGYAALESGNPNPPQRAVSLLASGDLDIALAWSCLARAADPGEGALLMGQVQIQRGDLDGALEALALAVSEGSGENTGKVLAVYDDLVKAHPADPRLHAGRAEALKRAGMTAEAIAAYERAIALDPDNPFVHVSKGELLLDLSQLDEAQTELLAAIRLQPDNVLHASVLLAAITWSTEIEQAKQYFRDAVSSPGEQPMPFPGAFYRALALAGLDRPGEAIAELKAAIDFYSRREIQHFNASKSLLERFREPPLPGIDTLLRLLGPP